MAKIAIIGYGNVGYHLAKALSFDHHVSIYGRMPTHEVNDLNTFTADGYDFILVTVSDDAIKSVATSFQTRSSIVLHTSGSRPLSDLSGHERRGVIYPLQTFSKDKKVKYEELQLFLESTPGIEDQVEALASCMSTNLRFIDSVSRAKVHLAAVFACNFSNHMYHIASSILEEVDLSFKDIQGLVEETLTKALEISPKLAQTGPAKRSDVSTLALHENLIKDDRVKEIYRLISQDIQQTK